MVEIRIPGWQETLWGKVKAMWLFSFGQVCAEISKYTNDFTVLSSLTSLNKNTNLNQLAVDLCKRG